MHCLLTVGTLWLTAMVAVEATSIIPTYMLKGSKLTCNEEGQVVVIPFLKQDPCITCMCFNSEIDCFKNTCHESVNCYYYQQNSTDNCCRKCRGCFLNGKFIPNSETKQDDNDPCTTYHCNSGTLTKYQKQCYVPCDNPISLRGQCCPSCNACPRRNTKDGEEVSGFYSDPCIDCHCFKGQMICNRKVCPILPCPKSRWHQPKNTCCPVCKGSHDLDLADNSRSCLFAGRVIVEKEEFQYDKCTTCVCKNSTTVCRQQRCRTLTCLEQVKHDGDCCAKCAQVTSTAAPPVIKECHHKNQYFKNGDRWNDSCHTCTCQFGQVDCAPVVCPQEFVCPYGYLKVKVNGECCDSCVREDGKCTVLDQMSNITTYDRKNYHLTGRCNYILTKDCETKKFSVHLVNKFKNSTDVDGRPLFEGNCLMVKLEGTRIYLSHLGRVRVNRTLVRMPYLQIGYFSIIQKSNIIKIRALSGVDINWTVNKSVEIKLKNHFQDKTCGLCGNFNLDPEDEFQTKRSKMLTNVNQFANSFKVGKNVLCPKKSQRTKSLEKLVVKTGEDTVKKVNGGCVFPSIADQMIATRICDRMRQRYPQCVGKISAETAYQQCESNVCSCKRDKQCQCLALEQYINTCNSIDGKFLKTSMCRSFNCPPGSQFKFCSFNCRKTCHNRDDAGQCRREKCKSGCECIGNRVWYKNQCIPEVMCPVIER